MTKRNQTVVGVDIGTGEDFSAAVIGDMDSDGVFTIHTSVLVEPNPLQRLIESNIITATEGDISWREGHLEHLANLYASDPVLTWRDYADDLTVALAHDARFAGMVEKARDK